MKQSRSTSFVKSVISTGVGFGLSLLAQWLLLPIIFGVPISFGGNVLFAVIMTVISIGRGYVLERIFEVLWPRIKLSPFMEAAIAERVRQIHSEGWSVEHDDACPRGELAWAGACYAIGDVPVGVPLNEQDRAEFGVQYWAVSGRTLWRWEPEWWKPADYRRDLVKACALIIAEGEKFDRRKTVRKPQLSADRGR